MVWQRDLRKSDQVEQGKYFFYRDGKDGNNKRLQGIHLLEITSGQKSETQRLVIER
jgi:hypothetical protein